MLGLESRRFGPPLTEVQITRSEYMGSGVLTALAVGGSTCVIGRQPHPDSLYSLT